MIRAGAVLAAAVALVLSGCGPDEPAGPPPAIPTSLAGQSPQLAVDNTIGPDAVQHAVDVAVLEQLAFGREQRTGDELAAGQRREGRRESLTFGLVTTLKLCSAK